MPAQKIGDVIARSGDLKALALHARLLSDLQQLFFETVPSNLAAASRITDFKAGTLVVLADNPAVAAKLRQIVPRVLKHLQNQQAEITGIRVGVQVKTHKIKAEDDVTRRSLPTEAIQDLGELAAALSPSPLKSALGRMLARRGRAARNKD